MDEDGSNENKIVGLGSQKSFLKDILGACAERMPIAFAMAAGKAIATLVDSGADIPRALLESFAQSIRDNTNARSIMTEGLAKAALETAQADPETIRATIEAHMPSNIRKARNRIAVAAVTIDELRPIQSNEYSALPLDEDWLNLFVRYAEDASSERLQLLFGKILAGEIIKRGSYSPKTLRITSELTKGVAQDFERIWSKSIGRGLNVTDEMETGDGWASVERLTEAGLLSSQHSVISPRELKSDDGLFNWYVGGEAAYLHITSERKINAYIRTINFTSSGMELGQVLLVPNHVNNLRLLANDIPKNEISKIILFENDQDQTEIIWQKP